MALIDNPQAIQLAKSLFSVYSGQKETQRNRNICDICGCNSEFNSTKHTPKRVVAGFLHRPELSPSLCWSHYIGWTKTAQHVMSYEEIDFTDNNQIDLVFASYLAKQLIKQSTKVKEIK